MKAKYSKIIKNQISLPVIKEAPSCVDTEASYTVEAAVAVPFFVGFLLVILFFFQVLITEQVLGSALLKTAKELAALSYDEDISGGEGATRARVILASHTRLPVMLDTDMSGAYIDLKATCQIALPIGLFDAKYIRISKRAKCRKWTGRTKEELAGEQIVYITPAGEAYHKTKECPYLRLTIRSVARDKIHTYRNKSGEKYYSCKGCTKEKGVYSRVYITEYGSCYHSLKSCSGLKRNVLAVRISSVKDRHGCLKCEGE